VDLNLFQQEETSPEKVENSNVTREGSPRKERITAQGSTPVRAQNKRESFVGEGTRSIAKRKKKLFEDKEKQGSLVKKRGKHFQAKRRKMYGGVPDEAKTYTHLTKIMNRPTYRKPAPGKRNKEGEVGAYKDSTITKREKRMGRQSSGPGGLWDKYNERTMLKNHRPNRRESTA